MAPSIETGDAVVTRLVHPGDVWAGQVVTFQDPSRSGELVTHRVIEVRRDGSRFSFVTAGDANTGVEQWSMEGSGTLGRLVLRFPKAGYVLGWLRIPAVRTALLFGGAILLSFLALRRIWGW